MLHRDVLKLLAPLQLDGVEQDDLVVEGAVLDAAQFRAEQLLVEMLPDTTTELLSSWERVLGLPDPCVGILGTTSERRAAVVAKYSALGGQSRAYFVGVAAKLGYQVTITEFRPFQVGISAVGDALYGDDWLHVWRVNAPAVTISDFTVGLSGVGDPLRSWGNELLECTIYDLRPAHTHVLFGYGGVTDNLIDDISEWTLVDGATRELSGTTTPGGQDGYTFTDDSATLYERAESAAVAYVEGETLYFDAWVAKDSDDSRVIQLTVYGAGGAAASIFTLRFKTNTGDYATSVSATASMGTPVITDYGDWWRISLVGTVGNGSTGVSVRFYPAVGLVLAGSNTVTATGSAVLGMATLRSSY